MISINRLAPGPENVPVPYAECRTFAFEYSVLLEKQLKRGIAVRPSTVLDVEIPLEKTSSSNVKYYEFTWGQLGYV